MGKEEKSGGFPLPLPWAPDSVAPLLGVGPQGQDSVDQVE